MKNYLIILGSWWIILNTIHHNIRQNTSITKYIDVFHIPVAHISNEIVFLLDPFLRRDRLGAFPF
jgi:hypothetical protein